MSEEIRFLQKPKNVNEFISCMICKGWDSSCAFDDGSKYCIDIKAELIRESISELKKQNNLSRYTYALCKIVKLTLPDASLELEWKKNLRQLRALLYTSAFSTARQRDKLFEISQNPSVVSAMRFALRKEKTIEKRKIEPTWIAVLFSEGSKSSIREAKRFFKFLEPETQSKLLTYLKPT